MGQLYCESDSGLRIRHEWDIKRIWKLSKNLENVEISVEDIVGLDSNTWFFNNDEATIRAIAAHAKRILEADVSFPPILTEDNRVFDGMHRIAKHLMQGKTKILIKKFQINPKPDRVIHF